jgi:hypothetical protein
MTAMSSPPSMFLLLFALFFHAIPSCLGASPQPLPPEPKAAMEWFQRASDRMNLRSPGAAPFHMKVMFHAFPGWQFMRPSEKPDIITGDGTYEETWLSPREWRREVSLADYHAVEADSGGIRKMQASSDYEPSRVLMLLDALTTPISRSLTSKEFHRSSSWKIDPVTVGSLSLVRLSKGGGAERGEFTVSFFFLPSSGVLAMSNRLGLVSIWSSDATFNGKVFATELTVKSLNNNANLLTAHISVEPAADVDPARFALEGPAAEPGTTLRPLEWSTDVRVPDLLGSLSWTSNESGPGPVFSINGVLDRHGRFRELEVILALNPKDVPIIMDHIRDRRGKPAMIDGTVCQVQIEFGLM